ncbi:MAG: glycine--tRNA ligase [Sulfurifustis sp.]
MVDSRIEELVAFCQRKGFFVPSCDLYGGLAGVYDYGPLGAELKNNFKRAWWRAMVYERDDVEGLDGAILSHPKLLDYAGHVDAFTDMVVTCRRCTRRTRADHVRSGRCAYCGSLELSDTHPFNTMFRTEIGSIEDRRTLCYLRPATAQHTFANFKHVLDSSGQRLPFGIAQIGKAFRNEVAPTDFPFRMREFEQLELQFFVEPGDDERWHELWLAQRIEWWVAQGLARENITVQDVPKHELAHYSKRTLDIYYHFADDFQGEIEGIANRTDYDLGCHSREQHRLNIRARVKENHESNAVMAVRDPITNAWKVPFVIEPAAGVDRGVMALLSEAYTREHLGHGGARLVLKLKPHLAPIKAAIVPADNDDGQIVALAKEIKRRLVVLDLGRVMLEANTGLGDVYRRHDEIGTPLCVTVDSGAVRHRASTVAVRDRDPMNEERIALADLPDYVAAKCRYDRGARDAGHRAES